MKRNVFFSIILLSGLSILFTTCKKKDEEKPPCNNKGTICFINKRIYPVDINIVRKPYIFTLQPNYNECVDLNADYSYEIKISGTDFTQDTTFLILSCENKLMIIQ